MMTTHNPLISNGGAERDRTVGLQSAILALSQLSYCPVTYIRIAQRASRMARNIYDLKNILNPQFYDHPKSRRIVDLKLVKSAHLTT